MDLSGKFGMVEMEAAAKVIYSKKKVYLTDMKTAQEQIGFLHLIEGGWLVRGNYNGEFIPTVAFIERIES